MILPKANLKQILQEFRSILSWGFYFTLLQLDEQLVDLYYKRCEEAVGFLVKRDAAGYCRCIQQVYMQLFHIIIIVPNASASVNVMPFSCPISIPFLCRKQRMSALTLDS